MIADNRFAHLAATKHGRSSLDVSGDSISILAAGGNLKIDSLTNSTTANTLYYNPATNLVSYGAAPAGGGGTVTSIATSNGITGGTITGTGTISGINAAADGATKGVSAYTANDFNDASGVISLDYSNGQAADATHKGFVTSTDWSTFNSKGSGSVTSIGLGLGTTGTDLGVSGSPVTGSGSITLNVPTASASNRGALSSTDWSTFNGKQSALVSGTSIKTVNSTSLLGSGDVAVQSVLTNSAGLSGALSDETGTGLAVFGTAPTLTGVIHAAGSTTAGTAPEYYTTSGASLLTSAVAGAREVDANGIQYYTHATGERGVSLTEQFISLTSNYTLTSQTAAQQAFNSTTSGQITVASSKSYYIEGFFALSSLSASSGTFGFALGGTATFTSLGWFSNTVKPGAFTSNAGWVSSYNTTTANTSLVTANTSTFGMVWIRGIVRVNAGGTIIPEISLGVAAAAVVNTNSWFKLIPVGTNTVTNVGNWN